MVAASAPAHRPVTVAATRASKHILRRINKYVGEYLVPFYNIINTMLLLISSLTILAASYLILATPAFAQCPVCIVTVSGGMYLAQKLGIDDLLISIWISALNVAITFWMAPKIKIKFFRNPYLLSLSIMALALVYFQFTDQIGGVTNRVLGIDKIILGQLVGLLTMYFGNFIYAFTKEKNHHHALFPYAKVVFPVGFVTIVTLVFKLFFRL